MGFYPQPNDWSCGPFALKHALAALGQLVSEHDVARAARTHWWSGTDEVRLAQAARVFGCEFDYKRSRDAEKSRKQLIAQLAKRMPAILCVDNWGHWITVLSHHQGRFVVVDSNMDPVLNLLSWPQLRTRWVYRDTDYDDLDPPAIYDFYAVRTRNRTPMRADMSPSRVRHLRHSRNHDLALHWDDYLEDLLEICRPRSARMVRPLSMAELLRRHEALLVRRTVYWHGEVSPSDVRRLLANLRFVAETYGLVIPGSAARRALMDITILTTMWVATARGTAEMYGATSS